jgi:hypothetical protein
MSYIESLFFVSLAITFVLILFLIYHFKQRISSLEQKTETMFGIVNSIVKEVKYITTEVKRIQPAHNMYVPLVEPAKTVISLSSPAPLLTKHVVIEDEDEDENYEEDDESKDDEEESEEDEEESDDEEEVLEVEIIESEPEEVIVMKTNEDEAIELVVDELVDETIELVIEEVAVEEPLVIEEVAVEEPLVIEEVAVEEPLVIEEVAVEEPLVVEETAIEEIVVVEEEPVVVEEEPIVVEEAEEDNESKADDFKLHLGESKKNLKKMNLTELKQLAAIKIPTQDISKLKKEDLIKLLKGLE